MSIFGKGQRAHSFGNIQLFHRFLHFPAPYRYEIISNVPEHVCIQFFDIKLTYNQHIIDSNQVVFKVVTQITEKKLKLVIFGGFGDIKKKSCL